MNESDATARSGWTAPDGWRELVTDGHVRAARLRWLQPWLITLASLAILVGVVLGLKVTPDRSGGDAPTATGAVEADRERVQAALQGLPPVPRDADPKKLVVGAELSGVEDLIEGELKRAGRLPTQLPIDVVTADAFWREPWPLGRLVTVAHGDARLVGVLASAGAFSPPVRWIALFAKRPPGWEARWWADGYLPDAKSAKSDLTDYPVTLRPLLPASAR